MIKKSLLIVFTLATISLFSQEIKRVEVSGKIIVDSDDKQGITVYNSSSNKGTVTDENGKFVISVTINDRVDFGALQFKDFTVIIDKDIIASKQMTVYLIEDVNKLDEVIILPYGLTGNLAVDSKNVKTFNPDMDAIYFGIKHMDEYEFTADYKTKVDNNTMHSQGETLVNGFDPIAIMAIMIKPLLKNKNNKNKTAKNEAIDIPIGKLKAYYSNKFLVENFNIPKDKVEEFVVYVEENGLDDNLLQQGKEMEFIEFINQKSQLFLKSLSEKN
jgi:hypothetical protein